MRLSAVLGGLVQQASAGGLGLQCQAVYEGVLKWFALVVVAADVVSFVDEVECRLSDAANSTATRQFLNAECSFTATSRIIFFRAAATTGLLLLAVRQAWWHSFHGGRLTRLVAGYRDFVFRAPVGHNLDVAQSAARSQRYTAALGQLYRGVDYYSAYEWQLGWQLVLTFVTMASSWALGGWVVGGRPWEAVLCDEAGGVLCSYTGAVGATSTAALVCVVATALFAISCWSWRSRPREPPGEAGRNNGVPITFVLRVVGDTTVGVTYEKLKHMVELTADAENTGTALGRIVANNRADSRQQHFDEWLGKLRNDVFDGLNTAARLYEWRTREFAELWRMASHEARVSAFCRLAQFGHVRGLRWAVDRGFDPDSRTATGTALRSAAHANQTVCAAFLLGAGASRRVFDVDELSEDVLNYYRRHFDGRAEQSAEMLRVLSTAC